MPALAESTVVSGQSTRTTFYDESIAQPWPASTRRRKVGPHLGPLKKLEDNNKRSGSSQLKSEGNTKRSGSTHILPSNFVWAVLAWKYGLACLEKCPFSWTRLRRICVPRGWSPLVPSFPSTPSTTLVWPQLAITESPIHLNSFSSMTAFRVKPESITALPSTLSTVQPVIFNPTVPSKNSAASLWSDQSCQGEQHAWHRHRRMCQQPDECVGGRKQHERSVAEQRQGCLWD
jgi:hypothetical protein